MTRFEELEEVTTEVKLKQLMWDARNEWDTSYNEWMIVRGRERGRRKTITYTYMYMYKITNVHVHAPKCTPVHVHLHVHVHVHTCIFLIPLYRLHLMNLFLTQSTLK